MAEEAQGAAFVRVAKGNPDIDELAALTAVLVTVLRRCGTGEAASGTDTPRATWRSGEQAGAVTWRNGSTGPGR